MKRNFTDLHLLINIKDPIQTKKLIQKAKQLGYETVAISFYPEATREEILKLKTFVEDTGLDFASRIDLHPRNPEELLVLLRKLRRKFEIICVLCENKEIARQAAKDHRVDLLNFPNLDYKRRFFDRAEAELATSSNVRFEIDVKPLILLEGPGRIRFLSSLRREIALAIEFRIPIIISSGATEELQMRKPRELAMIASLFGLVGTSALDAISVNPIAILSSNRQKLDSRFVAPGIRLIRQGEDN